MWDLRIASPFGRLSIRNMLVLAASILAAAFVYIFIAAPTTYAADAGWNGDNITYHGQQYTKQSDAATGDGSGLDKGTHVYTYTEPKQADTPGAPQKIHVITFAPSTDPTKETSATLTTYDFTPPTTYTNPTDKQTINISARTANDTNTTSCVVEGIGWIVCPVTTFLANAMDWLFGVLTNFLAVRPVQNNQDGALFRAWSIMRNFANVAFVIAFLVIIYSQVSSIGLSNYGLKKLLPRLVVAAVLVNISYWICAVAIDISNILGYSIEGIFMGMRDNITGTHNNHWDVVSWKSVTTAALSAGTLTVAGGLSLISIGSVGGAIYMLLPVLVGALIAALVTVVILAARQALITILVILAPLAFVAYLLPNTEKLFDKWQDTFTTMLVLFPAFAVLFGGSQLAGIAIIQNADSIVMVILGMAVQVAPLIILPLLIKLGGSILGRVAGIANDKSKGLIDQSSKYAKEQADLKKSQVLQRTDLRKRNGLSRAVQAIDNKRRKREGWQKANETMADATWANSQEAHKIHAATGRASLIKEIGEAKSEAHFEAMKRTNGAIQDLDLKARAGKLDVDLTKAKVNANWEEFKAGDARSIVTPDNLSVSALAAYAHERQTFARDIQQTALDTKLTEYRAKSAETSQSDQITEELLKNTAQIEGQTLQDYGGGVLGKTGAGSVFANAIAKYRSEYNEKVNERVQLLHHFNVEAPDRQRLALGESIPGIKKNADGSITTYSFDKDDMYAREAAIEEQLTKGSFGEIQDIILASGGPIKVKIKGVDTTVDTYKYRTSISDAIKAKNLDKKAIFFGAQTIDDIAQGRINGEPGLNMAAARSIAGGKISDEDVSAMKAPALVRLFSITEADIKNSKEYQEATDPLKRASMVANLKKLQHSAWHVIHTPVLSRNAEQAAIDILKAAMEEPLNTP